jgi:GntR family transcriptional regulator
MNRLNLAGSELQDDNPQVGYLYVSIADEIEKQIRDGSLPLGAPLPNERRMAHEKGISLGTARRAVELLRERGLVVTLRTFLVSRERREPMSPAEVKLV